MLVHSAKTPFLENGKLGLKGSLDTMCKTFQGQSKIALTIYETRLKASWKKSISNKGVVEFMRSRDIARGTLFAVTQRETHLIALKTGDREAYCFTTGEFISLHPNKSIEQVTDPQPGEYALDSKGRPVLARKQGEHYHVQYFIKTGVAILPKEQITPVFVNQRDARKLREEVNIIVDRLEVMLKNAQTMLETVKVMVSEIDRV